MSGMIAFRTILYFLITSLLSATVGLVLVVSIEPGKLEGLKQTLGNGECQAGRVCLSPFVCNLSTCWSVDTTWHISHCWPRKTMEWMSLNFLPFYRPVSRCFRDNSISSWENMDQIMIRGNETKGPGSPGTIPVQRNHSVLFHRK